MEVTIYDYYGLEHEPRIITGTVTQIEQQLRAHFQGAVSHIPFGNLYEMLRMLERATGIECKVTDDESKPIPDKPSPRNTPGVKSDPWVHELDIPEVPNPNL
jgi:hypothetical protein